MDPNVLKAYARRRRHNAVGKKREKPRFSARLIVQLRDLRREGFEFIGGRPSDFADKFPGATVITRSR